MTIPIIVQNHDWVLVEKAALTLSVPGRQGEDDARPCLGRMLEEQLQKRLFPVHRLDYEVSGLILYALSPRAHSIGQRWFENKSIAKTYHAFTQGNASDMREGQSFEWHNKIVRGKKRSFDAPHGKDSHTHALYRGLNAQGLLQWELHPSTGRPHQLRMQLSSRGFPIAGDVLYAATQDWATGIALKAVALDLSRIPASERLGLSDRYQISSFDDWRGSALST